MSKISGLLKEGVTLQEAYGETRERCRKYQMEIRNSCSFIQTYCPGYGIAVVEQANQFMDGMMVLCGTMGKPYFVGNPPKWSENPLNDNEFVWQLNRMEHWKILIQAFYLTGEIKYADQVLYELENWIDTCSPLEIVLDYKTAKARFASVHPWRSLEVGIRPHRSWNYCLEMLSCLPEFRMELFEKMVISLHEHGKILYQVCPIIWPEADHNHYLTECLGLLEISGMLPFLKDSQVWETHALTQMERCARQQVTSGGGQIEGCPTYHNECLHWLVYSLKLSIKYSVFFSKEYKDLVDTMFLYSLYSSRPDGTSVPWGDSDVQPYVYEAAFHTYAATGGIWPLTHCAAAFSKEALIQEFYKNIWELDEPEKLYALIQEKEFGKNENLPSTLHWDHDLKQVMLRTGWHRNAASVFFACRSPLYNDHAHIDPNGFDYYNQGFPILVDAGRYNYQEGPDRKLFKGGTYHNTVLINQEDAFEYRGTWEYGEQNIGDILNVGETGGLKYVCGGHTNYFPVIHTRMLAFNEKIMVVIDRIDNRSDCDQVNLYYHLNGKKVQINDREKAITAQIGNRCVSIAYSPNLDGVLLNGRASTEIDVAEDTTIINLNSCNDDRVFVTVLSVGEDTTEIYIEKIVDTVNHTNVNIQVGDCHHYLNWNYKNNGLSV